MPGVLYIVATPIGNLEDITQRALRILREVQVVAAEDTRHTRHLLAHYQIGTPLVAYHQHSDAGRTANLISRLVDEEHHIALVTDAGTPGVSDPGLVLVQAAIAAGVSVIPIPGASAALCALVASGLPTARFAFEGFLPRTKSSRRTKLAAYALTETRTLIFYEAPNRTADTLQEMADAFGSERPAAVGRELTKMHEEFVRGTLAEVVAHFAQTPARGEITILVAGRDQDEIESAATSSAQSDLAATLQRALSEGLTERDAVRQVSVTLQLPRRDVYAAMLALKNQPDVL